MSEPEIKVHRVTFQPNKIVVMCREDQNIAEAALEQGVIVPVSCENGVCQICQAPLKSGDAVGLNELAEEVLREQRDVLCCMTSPRSAIEIYMTDVYAPDHKKEVNLAFTVNHVEELADQVYRIELAAPAGKVLDYWAGQYCMVHISQPEGDDLVLPYSIANAPGQQINTDVRCLELHIAANSETAINVVNYIKQAIVVRVTMPAGSCFINESFLNSTPDAPLIFVASGSGFSQIKSLIELTLHRQPEREVHLYWSNKDPEGFYMPELPNMWAKQSEYFHYHPVIEQKAADWNGRAGWLYEVIHDDFDSLKAVQLFACGSPNMVYGLLDQLSELGLSEQNMHSDVFSYAPRNSN